MEMKRLSVHLPLTDQQIRQLSAGQLLLLNGFVYTARDAAHKKLVAALDAGRPLPFDIRGQAIYYTGPCPPKPGQIIGSAGPTTSSRMDTYTPQLLEQGLKLMIGKGRRSQAVVESICKFGCVYLGATGGAGALLARCITESELVAYPELGTEAIRRLRLENFPVVVLIDSQGHDLYLTGRENYLRQAPGSG